MSSTFTSEITSAATSHVLNTLSTLYANPPYAVLREFITNAIDAHRAAGYDGPVEVELPTRDVPRLVIRDHGNGMSRDTLVNTYYNYGESSKRGDDTSIGAFGFGSKSAYSVSLPGRYTVSQRAVSYRWCPPSTATESRSTNWKRFPTFPTLNLE